MTLGDDTSRTTGPMDIKDKLSGARIETKDYNSQYGCVVFPQESSDAEMAHPPSPQYSDFSPEYSPTTPEREEPPAEEPVAEEPIRSHAEAARVEAEALMGDTDQARAQAEQWVATDPEATITRAELLRVLRAICGVMGQCPGCSPRLVSVVYTCFMFTEQDRDLLGTIKEG